MKTTTRKVVITIAAALTLAALFLVPAQAQEKPPTVNASPVQTAAQAAAQTTTTAVQSITSAVKQYAPLPEAVSSFGAVASDGWLYVYGGHKGTTHKYNTETISGSFNRLNLADGITWEKLPSGPGLQGMNLASYEGKIYRVGGMEPRNKPDEKSDMVSIADVSRFDPKTQTWEQITPLPEPRSSHDVAFIGSNLYVVGGWNMLGKDKKSTWPTQSLVIDLAAEKPEWKTIDQPFQRRAFILAALDEKLYAIGGLSVEADTELEVDIYDPKSNSWSKGPELPEPERNGFSPAACVLNNRLYVSVNDGSLLVLSTDGKAWEKVGQTQPRIVHRAVVDESRVLVIGGSNTKGSNRDSIEAVEVLSVEKKLQASADKKSAVQTHCPVMTDTTVDADDEAVEYKGKKVLLCCVKCVNKWNKDPDNYARVEVLPQLQDVEVPARQITQLYCPIKQQSVVSPNDITADYKGKTVYLFDKSALRKWNSDPEKFANPALLPQLK